MSAENSLVHDLRMGMVAMNQLMIMLESDPESGDYRSARAALVSAGVPLVTIVLKDMVGWLQSKEPAMLETLLDQVVAQLKAG